MKRREFLRMGTGAGLFLAGGCAEFPADGLVFIKDGRFVDSIIGQD